jgi:glutaredoxin
MSLKVYSLENCPFSLATTTLLKQINPNIEIVSIPRNQKETFKKLIDHPTFPCTKLITSNGEKTIGDNETLEYLVNKSTELKNICSSQDNQFKDKLAKISINTQLSKRMLCNFYNALYRN